MNEENPDVEQMYQTPEDEDFYMEGNVFVFTAAFHLKRGFCCGSGCRHCPYGESDAKPGAEVG